jgi:hypothetical protein
VPLNPSKAAGPQHRWDQVLAIVAGLLPASDVSVVIDGGGRQPAIVADRLEAVLQAGRRPCARLTGIIPRGGESPRPASGGAATVWLADGPAWRTGHRCDVLIWLRTSRATQANPAQRDCPGDAEARADIVIDLHDPQWPVIRHVAVSLADDEHWYLLRSA